MSGFKQILKSFVSFETFRNKKFYKQLISEGDLCFDIGANLGKKSEIFLALGASVIAFEPQSSCHDVLANIKHKNFSYKPFAVGAKDEEKILQLANHVEVATFSNSFIDYFKNDQLQWNASEIVNVKKLDTLIDTYGVPNFCKIDVEGYEYEILSNLSHNIPLIEFEFTGGFIKETIKIIDLLDKENTQFNYMLNEKPSFQLKNWISGTQIGIIIKNMPIERLHGNIFVKN